MPNTADANGLNSKPVRLFLGKDLRGNARPFDVEADLWRRHFDRRLDIIAKPITLGATQFHDKRQKMTQDAVVGFLKEYLSAATDARPIYSKVADGLAEAVGKKMMAAQSHLPSERILAQDLEISRVTLRKAIDELVAAGLLVRRQGAKTVVARRLEKTLSKLTGFSEETRARGLVPGARWISKSLVLPTSTEAMALALHPGEHVLRLIRVRLADGAPISIERAALPASVLASGDQVGESLYDVLRGLGAAPVRGVQRIRAGVMTRTDAALLESEVGAPLLIIERRCFLEDGRAVEFTETRYNGESYEFMTELLA